MKNKMMQGVLLSVLASAILSGCNNNEETETETENKSEDKSWEVVTLVDEEDVDELKEAIIDYDSYIKLNGGDVDHKARIHYAYEYYKDLPYEGETLEAMKSRIESDINRSLEWSLDSNNFLGKDIVLLEEVMTEDFVSASHKDVFIDHMETFGSLSEKLNEILNSKGE